jgi:hypothetical protein
MLKGAKNVEALRSNESKKEVVARLEIGVREAFPFLLSVAERPCNPSPCAIKGLSPQCILPKISCSG